VLAQGFEKTTSDQLRSVDNTHHLPGIPRGSLDTA